MNETNNVKTFFSYFKVNENFKIFNAQNFYLNYFENQNSAWAYLLKDKNTQDTIWIKSLNLLKTVYEFNSPDGFNKYQFPEIINLFIIEEWLNKFQTFFNHFYFWRFSNIKFLFVNFNSNFYNQLSISESIELYSNENHILHKDLFFTEIPKNQINLILKIFNGGKNFINSNDKHIITNLNSKTFKEYFKIA
jgi:hypothetical protein